MAEQEIVRGIRMHIRGNLAHDEARQKYCKVLGDQQSVVAWHFIRFVENNGDLTETPRSQIGPDDSVITAVEPLFKTHLDGTEKRGES